MRTMPEQEHVSVASLRDAAARGVISPAQLEALLVGADALARHSPTSTDPLVGNEGDEQLRFVRSFGDIFIAIGVALALVALGFGVGKSSATVGSLITIVAGFGLAEWLVRQRRLALPGIVTAIGVTVAGGVLLPSLLGFEKVFITDFDGAIYSGGGAAAMAALFYWRHRLPFALLLIGGALFTMVLSKSEANLRMLGGLTLLCGLAAFAAAMTFDRKDRARTGRLSDCGFWLHILAAPLITHGFVMLMEFSRAGSQSGANIVPSLLLIGFFVVLCSVALFVDRRALLVSAFTYIIGAISQVMKMIGGDGSAGPLLVIGVFGAFVILLGVYWHSLREKVFANISGSALAQWVPPFRARAQA
jgi:hypothetical protein